MLDVDWEKYWKGQNRILEVYFDYLLVEKGLTKNTIFSYRRDFKLLSSFLYNPDWFKENVFSEKTKKKDLSKISNLNKAGRKRPLSIININQEILKSFFEILNINGFKNTSLARFYSTLKQFYDFEVRQNIMQENPIEFLDKPQIKRKLPSVLTETEIEALLKYVRRSPKKDESLSKKSKRIKIKCLIEVLYSTGVRISELVNLKLNDIDSKKRMLRILGKGQKERNVYFTSKVAKSLDEWIDLIPNSSIFLFPSHSVLGHITRDSVNKILADIASDLGLDRKKLSPHKLRHAFATHLLQKGADIRVIQELLGHSNISTTEIYTHILDSETLESVNENHPLVKSLS